MTTPEPPPRKEMAKRLREAKQHSSYPGEMYQITPTEVIDDAIATLEADEKPLLQIEEAVAKIQALESRVSSTGREFIERSKVLAILQAATSQTTGEAA